MRPAKTQISLGIHPVWSESSLCAQRVAKDPSFLHADSEDSDQTGRMPSLFWVFAGRTIILLVLSCRGSYCGLVVISWTVRLKTWNIFISDKDLTGDSLAFIYKKFPEFWLMTDDCHHLIVTKHWLYRRVIHNWASSWDYSTFLPPYTHSSNTHALPSSGARCLFFFWSDPSSTSILHVCEQRRLWRDCVDAQARLSLRWSPVW